MKSDEILSIVTDVVTPFLNTSVELMPDTEILDSGLIDSLNVLQVIAELEKRFAIKIGPLDMTFDDFRTCQAIADKVEKMI